MRWYWIVQIVVLYIVVGVGIAVKLYHDEYDLADSTVFGILWGIFAPVYLLAWPFFEGIPMLVEWIEDQIWKEPEEEGEEPREKENAGTDNHR